VAADAAREPATRRAHSGARTGTGTCTRGVEAGEEAQGREADDEEGREEASGQEGGAKDGEEASREEASGQEGGAQDGEAPGDQEARGDEEAPSRNEAQGHEEACDEAPPCHEAQGDEEACDEAQGDEEASSDEEACDQEAHHCQAQGDQEARHQAPSVALKAKVQDRPVGRAGGPVRVTVRASSQTAVSASRFACISSPPKAPSSRLLMVPVPSIVKNHGSLGSAHASTVGDRSAPLFDL
jgi:hypothetical protein